MPFFCVSALINVYYIAKHTTLHSTTTTRPINNKASQMYATFLSIIIAIRFFFGEQNALNTI